MALLNGEILWHLFWIVPIFVILFFAAWKRRKRLLSLYLGKRAEDPSFVTLSPSARFWRMICLLLVLLFLFLAASRPFWGNRIMPYAGEGRDLLIVFDVSKSMLAQDVRPSRLEHAKYLVRELVKLNPGDRFGLIAFAGRAFLECPMTMDKTSFLQNVDDLSTASIPVGGTNIEEALKTALAAFKAAESSHLAIILITDGDELTGQSSRVLEEAVRRKIPLFIAGIGDPSEPAIIQIPDEKGNLKTLRDEKGNIVNSRLNEKQLSHLAARTGGIYVRSSTTSTGLAQLENRIRSLDRYVRESGKQYRPIERPLYPLSAALFFLFLFFLIPEGRRKSAAKILLLSACLLFAGSGEGLFAQENGTAPAQQLSLPAQGQGLQQALPLPAEQVRKQESAALPESKDPYVLYDAARKAHFEEKDLAKAEKLYFLAINSASDKEKIRSGASLNLGVIRHTAMRQDAAQSRALLQKQDLQKALEKIKEAIRRTEAIQELYKYGLLGATREKAAVNQQILLNEKREAEKLQKQIEELLKKQQQARKNTQKALNKQQQQNKDQQKQDQKQQKQDQQKQDQKQDQKQQKQDQQKQDQKQQKQDQQKQDQKQQDQKQDQRKQDQQQQNDAQAQTAQAKNDAGELKKAANELGQKQMEQQAQKAQEELKKAQEAQQKGDGKKAEEHLKEAVKALGNGNGKNSGDDKNSKDPKKDKNRENGKDGKDRNGQDGKKDQPQAAPAPRPQGGEDPKKERKKASPAEEKRDYDRKQAEGLLELMVKDEKDLKDAMKARMMQLQKLKKVEKDW